MDMLETGENSIQWTYEKWRYTRGLEWKAHENYI